eukprot:CAMPEP_0184193150 /NCGR_PEP_ID=MMETSP0976-20121227/3838_1 /TAXON_ID=483370 /ORGANISM="non described non described, Strain CCMP2097" /LENGTH=631 /DNA_ID=CAMNT_0026497559 /DNA_START=3 /DNA_END=1898 /DNA_ORIENTATION=-
MESLQAGLDDTIDKTAKNAKALLEEQRREALKLAQQPGRLAAKAAGFPQPGLPNTARPVPFHAVSSLLGSVQSRFDAMSSAREDEDVFGAIDAAAANWDAMPAARGPADDDDEHLSWGTAAMATTPFTPAMAATPFSPVAAATPFNPAPTAATHADVRPLGPTPAARDEPRPATRADAADAAPFAPKETTPRRRAKEDDLALDDDDEDDATGAASPLLGSLHELRSLVRAGTKRSQQSVANVGTRVEDAAQRTEALRVSLDSAVETSTFVASSSAALEGLHDFAEEALEKWSDEVVGTIVARQGFSLEGGARLRAERDAAVIRADDAEADAAALADAAAQRVGAARHAQAAAETRAAAACASRDDFEAAAHEAQAATAAALADVDAARNATGAAEARAAALEGAREGESKVLHQLRASHKAGDLAALRTLNEQLRTAKQEAKAATDASAKWADHDERATALEQSLDEERARSADLADEARIHTTNLEARCAAAEHAVEKADAKADASAAAAARAEAQNTALTASLREAQRSAAAAQALEHLRAAPPAAARGGDVEAPTRASSKVTKAAADARRQQPRRGMGLVRFAFVLYAAALHVLTFMSYQRCISDEPLQLLKRFSIRQTPLRLQTGVQ